MTDEKSWSGVLDALAGITVGGALARSAALYGEQMFLHSEGRGLRFAEVHQRVEQLASGLLGIGVQRGEQVAIWLGNSVEWVLAFLACARIGAVVVPINTRYTAEEAGYILSQSEASALVMAPVLWNNDYLQMVQKIAPSLADAPSHVLQLAELPALRHLIVLGEQVPPMAHSFEALSQTPIRADLQAAGNRVTPADPLIIVYTSGTTGKPKGAMHNHGVIRQATRVGLVCGLQSGGAILGHMPLYHVAGLYMALVPALTLGACCVLMPQWNAARALDLMASLKVSVFGGFSTHYTDLAAEQALRRRDTGALKTAWIGGVPVMQATFMGFMQALGLEHLLSTYGMTENTISTTFNRVTDPLEACNNNRARVLGPTRLRIVDTETGDERAPGQDGEIWCHGETVMMGYYKNPQATRDTVTVDGWLKTGDLGRVDALGFLSITGRVKEMYKSGGTNVYPAEIEQCIARHPAVKLVSVIGVPDARLGEVGFAFVSTHPGQDLTLEALQSHCKAHLASYKIPRKMARIDAFPLTTTGKVQRQVLLDMAMHGEGDLGAR